MISDTRGYLSNLFYLDSLSFFLWKCNPGIVFWSLMPVLSARSIAANLSNDRPSCVKPPLAMPRMVRGGGIFEENDGRDRWQGSEYSEICDVRIPSGASRQLPLCPRGAFCGSEDVKTRVPEGRSARFLKLEWLSRCRRGLRLLQALRCRGCSRHTWQADRTSRRWASGGRR